MSDIPEDVRKTATKIASRHHAPQTVLHASLAGKIERAILAERERSARACGSPTSGAA